MVFWVLFLCCFDKMKDDHKKKGATIMKVLRKNGEIVEVSFEEQEGKKAFWHTSAHVLAQAVKRLWPDTKCAIGSARSDPG